MNGKLKLVQGAFRRVLRRTKDVLDWQKFRFRMERPTQDSHNPWEDLRSAPDWFSRTFDSLLHDFETNWATAQDWVMLESVPAPTKEPELDLVGVSLALALLTLGSDGDVKQLQIAAQNPKNALGSKAVDLAVSLRSDATLARLPQRHRYASDFVVRSILVGGDRDCRPSRRSHAFHSTQAYLSRLVREVLEYGLGGLAAQGFVPGVSDIKEHVERLIHILVRDFAMDLIMGTCRHAKFVERSRTVAEKACREKHSIEGYTYWDPDTRERRRIAMFVQRALWGSDHRRLMPEACRGSMLWRYYEEVTPRTTRREKWPKREYLENKDEDDSESTIPRVGLHCYFAIGRVLFFKCGGNGNHTPGGRVNSGRTCPGSGSYFPCVHPGHYQKEFDSHFMCEQCGKRTLPVPCRTHHPGVWNTLVEHEGVIKESRLVVPDLWLCREDGYAQRRDPEVPYDDSAEQHCPICGQDMKPFDSYLEEIKALPVYACSKGDHLTWCPGNGRCPNHPGGDLRAKTTPVWYQKVRLSELVHTSGSEVDNGECRPEPTSTPASQIDTTENQQEDTPAPETPAGLLEVLIEDDESGRKLSVERAKLQADLAAAVRTFARTETGWFRWMLHLNTFSHKEEIITSFTIWCFARMQIEGSKSVELDWQPLIDDVRDTIKAKLEHDSTATRTALIELPGSSEGIYSELAGHLGHRLWEHLRPRFIQFENQLPVRL